MQNAAGLGTGTITANGIGTTTNTANGELVVSSVTVGGTNSITLNGGILGSNNQAALSIVNTPVSVAANSSIAVRQFQNLANFGNLIINGNLTGSSNLNIVGPNAGTAFGTLTLAGNNSGYTGQMTIGSLANVQFNSQAAIGGLSNITLAGGKASIYTANNAGTPTVGAPGVNGFYYNFGSNPTASSNPQQYAVAQLYVDPRVFTRVDSQLSVPNSLSGVGTYPILAVPGFGVQAVGGINDGFMFKGLLNITTAGSYQFLSNVDDQDILFVDGVQVGAHTANNGTNV